MTATSRRKGAAGEREFAAAVLDALGVRLVRQLDQCRSGGFDLAPAPDDTSAGAVLLAGYAVEVKRRRAATPASVAVWWRQAVRQADAAGLRPLLAYRADRQPWHVVAPLHTLVPGASTDGPPHRATLDLEGLAATVRTRPDMQPYPPAGSRTVFAMPSTQEPVS